MSRVFDHNRKRPGWAPGPVECSGERCETLLEPTGWCAPGPEPRFCRSCQNQRYEAKIARTPQGARRKRRKALLAKKRRRESHIERDQAELAGVLLELGAAAARGAQR